MRADLALALVALAACSGPTNPVVREPMPVPVGVAQDDPRIGPCRREARSAPEVRRIAERMPSIAYGDAYDRWRDDMMWAERNGFLACLVREGALAQVPSGVEPVLTPRFGYDDRPAPQLLNALPRAAQPTPSGY